MVSAAAGIAQQASTTVGTDEFNISLLLQDPTECSPNGTPSLRSGKVAQGSANEHATTCGRVCPLRLALEVPQSSRATQRRPLFSGPTTVLAWSVSMVRLLLLAAVALVANLPGLRSAPAQTYPTRTVRFIVPFGPASGTDITARLFADRLATRWGKPVVGENRPGGGGLGAIGAFFRANGDQQLR